MTTRRAAVLGKPVGHSRSPDLHNAGYAAAGLGEQRDQALLFKRLATLRSDAPLFGAVDELQWRGPTERWAGWVERIGDARLGERTRKAWSVAGPSH